MTKKITKKFSGKRYTYYVSTPLHHLAKEAARGLRKGGFLARVTADADGYWVWYRGKGRK